MLQVRNVAAVRHHHPGGARDVARGRGRQRAEVAEPGGLGRGGVLAERDGVVLGHLLLAVVGLGAGLFALVWPAPTAYVLVIVVASWALVGGAAEFFAGFQTGESPGTRALFLLSGLVSFVFGVLLFARPGVGAVTLALLFGLYALIYGFSQITAGVQLRQIGAGADPRSELRDRV